MGILSWNALYAVTGTNTSYDGEGDDESTAFHKLGIGQAILGANAVRVNSMEFEGNHIGVVAVGAQVTEISENNFYIPEVWPNWDGDVEDYFAKGVYMWNSSLYTIEENHSYGEYDEDHLSFGFVIRNSGEEENEIYHNHFDDVYCGFYISEDNMGEVPNTGLQNRCNFFENGLFDIYLSPNASWRDDQGHYSPQFDELTNNKFSDVIGDGIGANDYDMVIHPQAFDYLNNPSYTTNYNCLDDAQTLPDFEALDPENSRVDIQAYEGPSLIEQEHCPTLLSQYDWPNIPEPGMEGLVDYNNAKDELAASRTLYDLTVDKGEKVNLIEEIDAAFPHESSFLRNLLLQKYPLSNDVMKKAITRAQPMDPWHLTQVLIANSKLDKELIKFLESSGVLSDFFMSFIYDAQQNSSESLKALLEKEVSYRSHVKHHAQEQIVRYFNFQVDASENNSAYRDFLEGQNEDWARKILINQAIMRNDGGAITSLLSELDVPHADFTTLVSIRKDYSANGDISPSQLANLWTIFNKHEAYYGEAGALLLFMGELTQLPEVQLPISTRSALDMSRDAKAEGKPNWISAYPNPAENVTFITYPAELAGRGTLSIASSQGQLVQELELNDKGVIELKLDPLKAGVYIVVLNFENEVRDNIKLVVK